MSEFIGRQILLMRNAIVDYQAGDLGLKGLVQRFEAISSVIGVDVWRDCLFAAIVVLEQTNAMALSEERALNEEEKIDVLSVLSELASHIDEIGEK